MNLLLPRSKITLRKNISQAIASALMIFSLLFSFVSHGEHYEFVYDVSEQHCHLCQHTIDHVENDVSVHTSQFYQYKTYSPNVTYICTSANNYLSPLLRAPPVQQ